MSHLSKTNKPSLEDLQSWGVDPSSQIEYYDGKLLVVGDAEPESGLSLMMKSGLSAVCGVAVFANAPLVGATMFLYAGYKIFATVQSLYGGDKSLMSRLEKDLADSTPEGWAPMPPDPDEGVRITTQLGEQSAIDVQAQSGSTIGASLLRQETAQQYDRVPQQQHVSQPTAQTPTQAPIENWVEALAKQPANLFIGAKGGTGKGIFLSNYARLRKQAQPKLKVFVIDPKNDPKERGYWQEDWIEYRGFSAIAMETDEIVHKLRELFSEYIGLMSDPNEAWLLVCDECLLITDELKNAKDRGTQRMLASQITRVISAGDSFDRNICVVSQSANAGDLGLSAGVMKTLTKIIMFRDGDEESLKHLYKHGQIVTEPTKPVIKDLLAQSPVKRGAYVSNSFKPVPRLTNYSTYDRDSRSYTQNEGATIDA